MTRRKILLDTDVGSDDCLALLMALSYPDIDVLGLLQIVVRIIFCRYTVCFKF